MRENKHPNIVNYVDSYLVGEELWVSCKDMKNCYIQVADFLLKIGCLLIENDGFHYHF